MDGRKLSGLILKALLIIVMSVSFCQLRLAAPARAATTILVPETYPTIQEAVTVAIPGDTISVASGTYTENITVDKSLTIMGRDPSHPPIIKSPITNRAVLVVAVGLDHFNYNYIIGTSAAVNLRLDNLYISANSLGPDPTKFYAGVLLNGVSGSGSGVYNTSIYGFGGSYGDGIYAVAAYGNTTTTVDNCTLQDFKDAGVFAEDNIVNLTINDSIILNSVSCSGIRLIGGPSAVVTHNNIVGGLCGIDCNYASNLSATNNEIHGQINGAGIMPHCVTATISHNTIYNITGDGEITGDGINNTGLGCTVTVDNNTIYSCARGIYIARSGNSCSITQNKIYNCGYYGVKFGCTITNFSQNIIYNSRTGVSAGNNLAAHCNAILGNSLAGLDIIADGTFDVINNYWGDNSGPNVNGFGPGTGDNITTYGRALTYNPWLTMHLSGSPASIVPDGSSTSTITLDCTHNSAGAVPGCTIPDGMQVSFTTSLGTLTSSTALTSGGYAVTTLRSGLANGTANLSSAFVLAPALTLSTTQVAFIDTPPAVTTGTGVYVNPSWFYLTGNLTELGTADTSVTPAIEYWGPVDGTWTLATMNFKGSFSTPTTFQDPPGAMPAGTYKFRAKAQGNQSGIWAYGDNATFIFQPSPPLPLLLPPEQLGINIGTSSHGSSLTTLPTQGPVQLPNVQVTAARLSTSHVEAGSPVTVTVDVTNKSAVKGNKKVSLYVNGQVESTQAVTVNSGSSSKLTFNISRSEPGDYSVYVDGVPAGSFKVEMVTGNDSILIFSIVLIAIVFLLGMVMLWRRQKRTV